MAKELGGLRRCRVSYSESVEDVIHKDFAIECKYGKQVPKYSLVSKPEVKYPYILIPSKFTLKPFGMGGNNLLSMFDFREEKRRFKFLEKGINQALSYNPDKIPLLCFKAPNMRGFIYCMRYLDFFSGRLRFVQLPSQQLQ